MHISTKCYIIYYSRTCFGRFTDHRQGVTQEYKQYINNFTECIIKTTRCHNILRCPFSYIKCQIMLSLKQIKLAVFMLRKLHKTYNYIAFIL